MRTLCALLLLPLLGCAAFTNPPVAGDPLISATYRPAWRGPAWDVSIDTVGNVRLETIDYPGGTKVVTLHVRKRLSPPEVATLRQLMKEAVRPGVLPRYDVGISDEDQLTLIDSESGRQVAVTGPDAFCDQDEVQRLLVLWKRIVRLVKPPDWRRPNAYCGGGG